MGCAADLHPLRETIDKRLKEGVFPMPLSRWVATQTPERPLSEHILSRHRRLHLGLAPITGKDKGGRPPAEHKEPPAGPPAPKPSEQLGRDVTDDDIEQRMKKRFYDAIDAIPPDKVAELMIEREKAKNRAPAPKPSKPGEDVPPDVAELRAAAAHALGPRRSRTGLRAVK